MSKMLEEVREQPEALEKTLTRALRGIEQLRVEFARRRPTLVVLAARGTSDNAAQFGRYLIEIATGIPVSLAAPSVSTLYHAALRLEGALVVAVSQSGESTDTNVVIEEAARRGAQTLGITNEAGSTLARIAQSVILVRAGREKSVAATKTYSGQLLAFYLLAYALGAPLRLADLQRLPGFVRAALKLEAVMAERAERYCFMTRALVVGRGLNYANTFEFALKLMETCYVVAERFSQADLLHGPIAMVERAFPAFLFAPSGPTWPAMKPMIEQLDALHAVTGVIGDLSNRDLPQNAIRIPIRLAHHSPLPEDLYTPVPYIIPAQMFAAHLAAVKHLDADRPRGLHKITQTL